MLFLFVGEVEEGMNIQDRYILELDMDLVVDKHCTDFDYMRYSEVLDYLVY